MCDQKMVEANQPTDLIREPLMRALATRSEPINRASVNALYLVERPLPGDALQHLFPHRLERKS